MEWQSKQEEQGAHSPLLLKQNARQERELGYFTRRILSTRMVPPSFSPITWIIPQAIC